MRLDDGLRKDLDVLARAKRKTRSELIRDILRESFDERPLGEKIGHLRGIVNVEVEDGDPWRQQIRERNWRA